MKPINLQQKNYSAERETYQLILPLDYEVIIPEDDSVRLLSQILEGLDYTELYRAYSSEGRNPAVEPRIMFKIMVYAYTNEEYSSRKIEKACKRDINFMWLLSGSDAPDHTTISRFRKDRLGEVMEGLFYQFISVLHELGVVNRSIQSEGAFGDLKQDRQFTRFLTRGVQNVKTETLLLCFGHNVNKLHAKIQSNRCGKDLHELKTA